MAFLKRFALDTNIFLKENYLEGKRIKQLLKLCEDGVLQMVVSLITVNEVKARFQKAAQQAVELHNELLNKKQLNLLRNLDKEKLRLEKFPKVKDLAHQFNAQFDAALLKAKATILPYPRLDVSDILEDYFSSRPPFNKPDKKCEFPDAFALKSIDAWCHSERKKCTFFSKDKDFQFKKDRYLQIDESYETYLEEALKCIAPERTSVLPTLYVETGEKIDKFFKEWLHNQLDDFTKYYEYSNWLEVHDITITKIEVTKKEFEVLDVKEENIEVEVIIHATFEVEIVVDDENSYYKDDDDGSIHYIDTTTLELKKNLRMPMIVSYFVESSEDYDTDFDVISMNDYKDFHLPKPYNDF